MTAAPASSGTNRGPGGLAPGTHVNVLAAWSMLGGAAVFVAILLAWWGWGLEGLAGSVWMGPWAWVLPGVMSRIVGLVVTASLVLALAAILGGVGLLLGKEWGRVVTLSVGVALGIFAVATAMLVPLAYGLYAVWVLTRSDVAERFKEPATAEQLSGDDEDASKPA